MQVGQQLLPLSVLVLLGACGCSPSLAPTTSSKLALRETAASKTKANESPPARPVANRGRNKLDVGSLFVSQPTVRPNPIQRAPLIAILDFETAQPVTVQIEVDDGTHHWHQTEDASPRTQHSIAVLGLRPNRPHQLRVHVTAPGTDDDDVSDALTFHTPPLPDSFPPLRTTVSKPNQMEPGVTFFAVNLWQESSSLLDYGYIVALDEGGEVVWFCNVGDRIADMRVLENGHLLYQHGNYRYAYEIDLLGRDHNRWVATNLTELPDDRSIPVETDTIHHDLLEMPSGNFLSLTTELRHFERFPTSEFTPDAPWQPAFVVTDRVFEFDPGTGQIQNEFPLVNVLDRQRFGYMALSGFWKDKYDYLIGSQARDWSHANALLYVPDENAIIVSFRHLDCLIKLDWDTKQIRWILGDPGGWREPWHKYLLKPVGDLEWMYHQHSPQLTPRGTLMMYDNGNYRARPFDKATLAPDNQSRVVEFRIDEDAMTVEQIYEYRGTDHDRFYCPFYCEADWLPETSNILVTDGGHIETAAGVPDDNVPGDRQWARIFEITRDEPPQKVFEVVIRSEPGSPFGWSVYRANRLPNLRDGFRLQAPGPNEDGQLFPRVPHIKRTRALNALY